jgi:hypothetical protein
MKFLSLKNLLYNTIKEHPLYLEEIYDICDSNGYKHDNATRRLRELVDSGLISRIMGRNAIIGYKTNYQETRDIPLTDMPEYEKYRGLIWKAPIQGSLL